MWCPFDKKYVDIDEKIAPLIKTFWKLNIRTFMSCQKHEAYENSFWVKFPLKDIKQLIRIFHGDHITWDYRVFSVPSDKKGKDFWHYRLNTGEDKPGSLELDVFFPWNNYQSMLKIFRDAERSRKKPKENKRKQSHD